MSVNLPPQAYTRDMMGQAFEWLQTQPTHIREMATNMDAVVTLYLQHRRRADSGAAPVTTNPVSAQNFKKDLKNLADGLKQFENGGPTDGFVDTPAAGTPISATAAPTSGTTLERKATPPTQWDARTRMNLERVRTGFNLSSTDEALRMLVELGFERVKEILPKP